MRTLDYTALEFAQRLPADFDVRGLNFPVGLRGLAPSIRDLAHHYLESIQRIQPEGPFFLVGYSSGENLAVEMALLLEARGEVVEHLVLIDAHPPHAYVGGQCDESDYLQAFPELLRSVLGGEVSLEARDTWQSPLAVIEAVHSPALSAAVRRQLLVFYDVWCDNHAALKTWLPDRRVQSRTTVLEATEPEPERVLSLLDIKPTLARDWCDYVLGEFSVRPISGDHYSILGSADALAVMEKP